jgi:hypothetical protein
MSGRLPWWGARGAIGSVGDLNLVRLVTMRFATSPCKRAQPSDASVGPELVSVPVGADLLAKKEFRSTATRHIIERNR